MIITPHYIRKLIRENKTTLPDGRILLIEEFYIGEPTNSSVSITKRTQPGSNVLVGKLQEAEALNHNNRIYPKDLLKREISKYMKLVRERKALGVLDHPDHTTVNLKEVSHLISELWWEGNAVFGKVELLPGTPCGDILISLSNKNIPIGMSSRGVGTIEERHGKVYVTDYQLICWDAVSDPSTHNAYVSKQGLNESVIYDNSRKSFIQNILGQ